MGVKWDDNKGIFAEKPLSKDDLNWIEEHPECCYHYGQPCYCWQCDEDSEDCECVLGREYYSLVLEPSTTNERGQLQ